MLKEVGQEIKKQPQGRIAERGSLDQLGLALLVAVASKHLKSRCRGMGWLLEDLHEN